MRISDNKQSENTYSVILLIKNKML